MAWFLMFLLVVIFELGRGQVALEERCSACQVVLDELSSTMRKLVDTKPSKGNSWKDELNDIAIIEKLGATCKELLYYGRVEVGSEIEFQKVANDNGFIFLIVRRIFKEYADHCIFPRQKILCYS